MHSRKSLDLLYIPLWMYDIPIVDQLLHLCSFKPEEQIYNTPRRKNIREYHAGRQQLWQWDMLDAWSLLLSVSVTEIHVGICTARIFFFFF